MQTGADIVAQAAQIDGVAAQVREAQKADAFEDNVEHGVCILEALTHEAYGAMAKSAGHHVKRLGTTAAASGKLSKSAFMHNTMLALSIAQHRRNGLVVQPNWQPKLASARKSGARQRRGAIPMHSAGQHGLQQTNSGPVRL